MARVYEVKDRKTRENFLFLIALFSKLIGYFPFCKYLKGENIVYEWGRKHQEERFNELIRISNKSGASIIQLEKL
jgi:hypothetical protein